ncbi:FAD binding domain-containing protein [Paraphoma chrysanthemicola]|nr:FAD binding domain-containing protein [Paraphoma chrysanthemicola]
MRTISPEVPVLIAGGGPAGLLLSLQLAKHGVKSILVERNDDTTKWPKMDITNCRSMELFNRLGISEGLRSIGVPDNYSFDVLFSTGLQEDGEKVAQWELPSPRQWRENIRQQNDGTMPREPYQRCSQAIFEAWLKKHIQQQPLIEAHFGVKFESLEESEDGVVSHVVDVATSEKHNIRSQYVAGCDGAGSRVRKSIGIDLIGGPVPGGMFLVHFKSRDLTKLHRHGQFWHIFFSSGGVIISQDEVDTWTTHLLVPLGVKAEDLDAKKAVYEVLGGSLGPYPIEIDEILVNSVWRPNICVAEKYASSHQRVFLAGDAAHQNIPTGGYGMNTAVGDSFDLGWKLAAALKGHGGKHLLASYEIERKPVAVRNIERSGVHHSVHQTYWDWIRADPKTITTASADAEELKKRIKEHVTTSDGENRDHGIEMDYRYNHSPVIVNDEESEEPPWSPREYHASTWPGARAPHVFLADGETSIFDLFGREFTIVDFSEDGEGSSSFVEAAERLSVPLKRVHLPFETHVRKVWGRDILLIRPDDHVAWRSAAGQKVATTDAIRILEVATGRNASKVSSEAEADTWSKVQTSGFTGTVGNEDQNSVKMRAEFQT